MDEKLFQALLTAEQCKKGSRNIGEAEDIVLLAEWVKSRSPQRQTKRLRDNMVLFVSVRKTLRLMAEQMSWMEKDEAFEFLDALRSQILILESGDTSSELWKQATSSIDNTYGLERIEMSWKENETNQ